MQTAALFAGLWQPLGVPGAAADHLATWPDVLFGGSSLALAVVAASAADADGRAAATWAAIVYGMITLVV
jgi:hypothetical protein